MRVVWLCLLVADATEGMDLRQTRPWYRVYEPRTQHSQLFDVEADRRQA